MRLLVTDTAAQSPRQATAWLITTLGRTMKNRITIISMVFALAFAAGHAAEKEQMFAIGLAPAFFKFESGSAAGMLWLIYANCRVEYAENNSERVLIRDSRVVPSFDDEVMARRRTVEMLKAIRKERPELSDSYWESVERVVDAGYIEEYVWHYLRQKEWTKVFSSERVLEFQNFRLRELTGHEAMTLASVIKK